MLQKVWASDHFKDIVDVDGLSAFEESFNVCGQYLATCQLKIHEARKASNRLHQMMKNKTNKILRLSFFECNSFSLKKCLMSTQ